MNTKIGKYDPETRSVPVIFDPDGIAHTRNVNACLQTDGSYDRKATAARVAEVALGVGVKIALGVIAAAPDPDTDTPNKDTEPTG